MRTPRTNHGMESPESAASASARKQASAFLEKLYDILDSPTYAEYIGWQPDGQSFLIKKVEDFSRIVLPAYYKHNNLQSFVRQLNMYSFSKTRHDANWREFRQINFQRGRKDLLPLIKRKTQMSHRSGAQAIAHADSEPKHSSHAALASNSSSTQEGEVSDTDTSFRCTCAADVELLKTRVGTLETQLWVMTDKYNEVLRYVNEGGRDRGLSIGSSTTGGHDDIGSTTSSTSPPEQDSDSCATSDAMEVTRSDSSKIALVHLEGGTDNGLPLIVRQASIDSVTTVESLDSSAVRGARTTRISNCARTSDDGSNDNSGGNSSIIANTSKTSGIISRNTNNSNNSNNNFNTSGVRVKKEGLNAIAEVAQFMEIRKQRGKVSLESFMEDAAVLAARSLVGMDGAGDDSCSSGSDVCGSTSGSSSCNSDKEGLNGSTFRSSSIEAQSLRSSMPETALAFTGSHDDADIPSPRKKTRSIAFSTHSLE